VRPTDWKPSRGTACACGPGRLGAGPGSEGGISCSSPTGAVMEIKWGRGQGPVLPRRSCGELSRRIAGGAAPPGKTASRRVRTSAGGVRSRGFQWDAPNERAVGVLLYCAACRTDESDPVFERPETASIEHPPPGSSHPSVIIVPTGAWRGRFTTSSAILPVTLRWSTPL